MYKVIFSLLILSVLIIYIIRKPYICQLDSRISELENWEDVPESTQIIYELARRNASRVKYYEDLDEIKATKIYDIAIKDDCGYITFTESNIWIEPHITGGSSKNKKRAQTYKNNIKCLARPRTGTYLFNLHDVNTVPNSMGLGHPIGIYAAAVPDLYQINNYNGYLKRNDTIPFQKKTPRIIFAGASTGSSGPDMTNNDRVNYCKYVAERKNGELGMCDFYLTSIVQCSPQDLRQYLKNDDVYNYVTKKRSISPQVQKNYKYIFNIDGNGAAWDRPIWIMNSNSLLMRSPTKYEMWYSSLLREGEHFLQMEKEEIVKKYSFCESNPKICENIIANAHQFVTDFAFNKNRPPWGEYMHFFLEALHELKSP